ncbi:MAG: cytochrome c [Planctomycetota bacterium]|nr:cytochrome c [Planctomycetota bacterium]
MQTSFQPLLALRSVLAGLLLLGVAGCDLSGAVPSAWGLSQYSQDRLRENVAESTGGEEAEDFKERLQAAELEVLLAMEGLFGQARSPHWPMGRTGEEAPSLLAEASAVYQAECAHCHGPEGFGDGPSSLHLKPAPWNFAIGVFPRSAPTGGTPKLPDLKKLIADGIPEASMPPFERLGDEALIGVTGHVLLLTRRAKVEPLLVEEWIRGGPGSLPLERALEIYQAWESDQSRTSLDPNPSED